MQFNKWWYDRLKWVALVVLPATSSAYLGLSELWGFPNALQVVGTIAIVDTFMGVLLGISTKQYNSNNTVVEGGFLEQKGVDPDTGIPHLKMTITSPPEELLSADTVKLKVGEAPPPE